MTANMHQRVRDGPEALRSDSSVSIETLRNLQQSSIQQWYESGEVPEIQIVEFLTTATATTAEHLTDIGLDGIEPPAQIRISDGADGTTGYRPLSDIIQVSLNQDTSLLDILGHELVHRRQCHRYLGTLDDPKAVHDDFIRMLGTMDRELLPYLSTGTDQAYRRALIHDQNGFAHIRDRVGSAGDRYDYLLGQERMYNPLLNLELQIVDYHDRRRFASSHEAFLTGEIEIDTLVRRLDEAFETVTKPQVRDAAAIVEPYREQALHFHQRRDTILAEIVDAIQQTVDEDVPAAPLDTVGEAFAHFTSLGLEDKLDDEEYRRIFVRSIEQAYNGSPEYSDRAGTMTRHYCTYLFSLYDHEDGPPLERYRTVVEEYEPLLFSGDGPAV